MIKHASVYNSFIFALFFCTPFFVTVFFRLLKGAPIGLFYVFIFLVALYAVNRRKFILDGSQLFFALAFFGPVFVTGFIGLFYASVTSPLGLNYQPYISESIGRFINLFAMASVFLVACSIFNSSRSDLEKQRFIANISWFYFSALLIISIFGFWQFVSNLVPAVPFPFETRVNVHGIQDRESVGSLVRLTSIANEPSYLAPLLIDGMILSLLLFGSRASKLFVVVFVVLLALTFSGGGYLNVVVIAVGLVLSLTFRSVTVFKASPLVMTYFLISCLIATSVIITMHYLGVIAVIADRLPHILDVNQHSRAFMVLMPFAWAYESGPINFLFGHGVKSYALIGEIFIIPSNNEAVHVTSNNAFTDIFWELGLVGLILLLSYFCYVIFLSVTPKVMLKEHWISLLITLHLIGSSLYRADFASPRFLFLVLLTLFLLRIAKTNSMKLARLPKSIQK